MITRLPIVEQIGWPWDEESNTNLYKGRSLWPKLTIITPSFNQGPFIEQTIRSILLQNYPNLEYIVIDGGSSDNTVEILKKYSDHLTYWVSEKDNGQSHAINKGIEISTGDYLNWINSDDYLAKDALFAIGKQIGEKTDLIAGYCTVFTEPDHEIEFSYRINIDDSAEKTIVEHSIAQPSMFYKTEIFKKYNGVDETLHYTMDLALFARYVTEYGTEAIKLIDEPVSFFRKHVLSKTQSSFEAFELEERKIYSYLLKLSGTDKAHIKLITKDSYEPNTKWEFNLNPKRIQNFIYNKFLLKKALNSYAIFDYSSMKKFTEQYLSTGNISVNYKLVKLLLFTKIIPYSVLNSFRKVYKNFNHKGHKN